MWLYGFVLKSFHQNLRAIIVDVTRLEIVAPQHQWKPSKTCRQVFSCYDIPTLPKCHWKFQQHGAAQARAKHEKTGSLLRSAAWNVLSCYDLWRGSSSINLWIWTFLSDANRHLRLFGRLPIFWKDPMKKTKHHTIRSRVIEKIHHHHPPISHYPLLWNPCASSSLCQEAKSTPTYRAATPMKHLPHKLHSGGLHLAVW